MGGKYTADDNRSMQLNPNNDRYYSSREGNQVDECFEIYEGDNDMGTPFFVVDNKLVKKSTITEVIPHFECETELVDNVKTCSFSVVQAVKLTFNFSADIYTSYGNKLNINLPKMKPDADDEYSYSNHNARNGRTTVLTEESLCRVSESNFGEVLHVEPGVFETRREEICNLYALNIVHRYMNSIFAK